ncbi:hypothetical protein PIB30_039410 [Stylosanthes scabra]|uniref:Uncharacterized protein n=1 Tax=Stylosanthes scabra TaxID=79078 RepID=A0ABU6QDQ7_9FABA|nr:hypothetical protein [Stylosanthes scabra]
MEPFEVQAENQGQLKRVTLMTGCLPKLRSILFISRALQARNENYTYLGSAETEIRQQFEIHPYLGSAEPEIRISGLQSPR